MKRFDIKETSFCTQFEAVTTQTVVESEGGEYVTYETAAKLARVCELMEKARAMRAMDDCSNKAAQYEIEASQLYKEAMEE